MSKKKTPKQKFPALPMAAPPDAVSTPDAIAVAAYYLWESAGRPTGRHLDHWLQAEIQLQQGRKEG
jgi:hypothetical protein